MQTQMLAAMVTQGEAIQSLGDQVKEIVESQKSGTRYISNLEQNTAPPAAGVSGELDWHTMNQQELAENVARITNYQANQQITHIAQQFGEMMELIVPQWDGWKHREAIYGLMAQKHSVKDAYKIATQNAAAPIAEAAQSTKEADSFQNAVEKRAAEMVAQHRGVSAGAAGKPARNDATAQSLTARELNRKLYAKLMAGEKI